MMFFEILSLLRYSLVLLFGILVSASFSGIRYGKKNCAIFGLFFTADAFLQLALDLAYGYEIVFVLYPLLTHIPLVLILVLIYSKPFSQSVLAVSSAYLCCQLCNWLSEIPALLNLPEYVSDIVYILAIAVFFPIIMRFVAPPVSKLMSKPRKVIICLSIVPVFYYIFDYAATVYTDLLYSGNRVVAQLAPFMLCMSYLIFCVVYFKQHEESEQIETKNKLMIIRWQQAQKEVETIRRSEEKIAIMRHDMRHFLNGVLALLNDGDEKAKSYVEEIIDSAAKTVKKRYTSNDTVNLIISFYENMMEEKDIRFFANVGISKELLITDVDITQILSNALENAINAVCELESKKRSISLEMGEKGGKLLICVKNPYKTPPKFIDGMPVSDAENHGFGTQSICYTAEKLNGNCMFSCENGMFILRVII